MTQIVDERLKKMCDECHSHLDKPCAWLSLGNEYCEEIMNIQQELQEIKKEHGIMKEFIYENGLWEKFLNDDRFIEHLRN